MVEDPLQFGDPLVYVPLAARHQPVGVEGEQAALGQFELGGLERQSTDAERRSRLCAYRGPGAVRRDDQRQRMAGARQREAAGDRVVDRVQAGRPELAGRLGSAGGLKVAGQVEDQVVQVGQQLVRRQVDVGEVRTAVRSRPMPWPTTSPTTRATRAPDSGMTSNQSPPTSAPVPAGR